jgi:ribosome-associated protein
VLVITDTLAIGDDELEFAFVRSSGPGGQNVNKVSTAVQLRFDAAGSPSLPEDVLQRLLKLAGRRATEAGVIIIDARRERTQERNRQDAIGRLVELIRRATEKPKPRKATRPTLAAKQRRVDDKKRRGKLKRDRGDSFED